MIICKLTGNSGRGVKAHIIPRAFYEIPPQNKGLNKLISNTKGVYPKRNPEGIYDPTIVTKEGENLFNIWDNYAVQLLINEQDKFKEIVSHNEISAWSLPKYNYQTLKLFVLSVLWRASVSSHTFFSKVKLGVHENIIKEMLLHSDPGSPELYSVNIVRWVDNEFGSLIMCPFRERYHHLNYFRFYCGRYILYIKTDNQKTFKSRSKFQLNSNKPLYVIARSLQTSKEWSAMQKISAQNLLPKKQ